jgi:hypothetical protein
MDIHRGTGYRLPVGSLSGIAQKELAYISILLLHDRGTNMQKNVLFLFLIMGLNSRAQTGTWHPFKLCVIKPDTAVVAASLMGERDSIEAENLRAYYTSLKQMEQVLAFRDYSKETERSFKATQEKIKEELPVMRAKEGQVKAFRYYQTISQYSAQVYQVYFNDHEPFSTIIELPSQSTDMKSLHALAEEQEADYIVFYDDIHTVDTDRLPVLKLTTRLYSKKGNKIIFEKETEGDNSSRGAMWICNKKLVLSCLLINAVRTSTDEVTEVLRKLQTRKD